MEITLYNIKKGIRYLKHYGWKEFKIRLSEKREPDIILYSDWLQHHVAATEELSKQSDQYKKWLNEGQAPLVSIVVSADSEEPQACENLLKSLERQTYKNYELCTIALNDRAAFDSLHGDYVTALEPEDELEPNALFELMQAVICADERVKGLKGVASIQSGVHWTANKIGYRETGNVDIVYSDEDITDAQGQTSPVFKTDFDYDFFKAVNYFGKITLMEKALYADCAGDMGLAVQKAGRITHVPKVLCHSKTHNEHEDRAWDKEAGTEELLQNDRPLVSIIIPNKDETEALKKCIAFIRKSTYNNYEIIIVENNSVTEEIFDYYKETGTVSSDKSVETQAQPEDAVKIDIVTWKPDKPGFNYSAINNYGAAFAKGEYLILLNNDIEIITNDWIEKMLGICQRKDVGIVGAKLYYPDDTIQHAGIVVGVGGHARGIGSNMLTDLPRDDMSHWDKTHLVRECSAVTAACLMIKKQVFDEVGGFEEYLTVAFNDVDLCLKVRKKGYSVVFNPHVEAYHYESKTRGQEDTDEKVRRFQTEIEYMRTEWNDILRYGDPYYNPGYSRVKNDYSLNGMS